MQAVAWEYVDSRNVAWKIYGQHSRDKRIYCIRGNLTVGMFDPDQSVFEEPPISRWPEIVRAKWRDVVKAAGKAVR